MFAPISVCDESPVRMTWGFYNPEGSFARAGAHKERVMKIIRIAALLLVAIFLLGSCGNGEQSEEVAAEAPAEEAEPVDGITVENAFYFTHVNGHKEENEMIGFVMFEYEQLKTVRYQVAYIACTCRSPEVNYWTVANVELNKADASIAHISYDEDSTGHYTAGMYGDSYESWDGTPVKELFDQFIEDNIRGASAEEIMAYEAMHGDVDAYTGATVTPNNAMRMLQGLIGYHNERYGNA